MDNWDQEAIDLVQPGFIEFGEDGLGSLGFIAVTGNLALAERSGFSAKGYLAMAAILAAKDDPAAALTWTERGLGIETSYDLRASTASS